MGELQTANAGSRPKLYGRKRGKRLRAGRQRLMDERLPQFSLTTSEEPIADLRARFPANCREIRLEIGFGDGGHLAWQAAAKGDIGFIGCEPYEPGVASLLSQIERLSLDNVRIYHGDARELLACLPGNCLTRAYILFPDPWPKKRHHKRRFISPENLNALARVMAPGAELWFATDIGDYARWALRRVLDHPDFVWLAESPRDWLVRPDDRPPTKYEAKAIAEGRDITYLRFQRIQAAC